MQISKTNNMKLYIAEKPSLARAIADALPKPHKKQDGYIEVAGGDIVSWCIGHLLEQAEPDSYDDKYKKWNAADLPIVPETWQLKPKAQTRKQLTVLKKLIKQADVLVNAGDPDREGQLLVDEVIDHAKPSKTKKQNAQRLLVSDLNVSAVKKSLSNLKPNSEFIPLSVSALARSRADWLYGMNLTRAYTLAGQKAGFKGVLSVGRVQTPILGLVVRRDLEILNFVPHAFYEVLAHLNPDLENNTSATFSAKFSAKWQPSEACEPYMDDEGRVLHKGLAQNVVSRINNQIGSVLNIDKKQKKNNAPLPYNLSALQIDAAKAFGMAAQQVLDTCQNLYERHKLITYPRSDNRYLPKEHHKEASQVLAAIKNNQGQDAKKIDGANTSMKSKCWNDKKVEAHHAIIPTSKKLQSASLTQYEKNIYQLVSRHYLAQFYPEYIYNETQVEIEIAKGLFKTKAKQEVQLGFKVLMGKSELDNEDKLPALVKGQQLLCVQGELIEKQTQPPAHFTDATLLAAMTGIARFVKDPEVQKVLKETDGLGTEATRAGIIELLFRRDFLKRQGKQILATESGIALIQVLPEQVSKPDLTAVWESSLGSIAQKELSYQHFMQPLLQQLNEIIDLSKTCDSSAFKSLPEQKPNKKFRRKRKTYKKAS